MNRTILAGGVALLLSSTAVLADCVQAGLDVTCAGSVPGGFGDGSDATDKLRIVVQGGATVTDADITADPGDIEGAIFVDDKARVTVQAGGTVRATGREGVSGDNDLIIVNNGVIEATDDAIQVNDGATITNAGRIENIGTDTSDPQDAIDIDSGVIDNLAGGIIRSTLDAAIDTDAGEKGPLTVTNAGLIQGTIGVLQDPGNTSGQLIYNRGTLTGTGGVAFDLGLGADHYSHLAGGVLNGTGLFGAGDDTMAVFDLSGTGRFGGTGAVMDGGAGTDIFSLSASIRDLIGASHGGGILDLAFGSASAPLTFRLIGWEEIRFTDFAGTPEAVVAAVPLPAGGLLLLSALGLAGTAARRRR